VRSAATAAAPHYPLRATHYALRTTGWSQQIKKQKTGWPRPCPCPPSDSPTSCAIRDQRGQRRRYWPPSAPWVQWPVRSWAGLRCGPGGQGSNLPPGPLGSVAGGPDRRRGAWFLCPSPLDPGPGGWGKARASRVFPARRSGPQLQVHAPARAVAAHPLAERLQTGPAPLHMPIFTVWRPGLVPIQTGAPAQIRAADRPSDTPAVRRGRCVASVDHTGL
jgi:hypothetical protein